MSWKVSLMYCKFGDDRFISDITDCPITPKVGDIVWLTDEQAEEVHTDCYTTMLVVKRFEYNMKDKVICIFVGEANESA